MDRRIFTMGALATVISMPAISQQNSPTRSLAERFAATLTAHDIDGFAALFADDFKNHQMSVLTPPPPQGKTPKQATVAVFAARLAGIPDLNVVIEAIVEST